MLRNSLTARGMAQMPSKCEILSSNPSTTTTKKTKQNKKNQSDFSTALVRNLPLCLGEEKGGICRAGVNKKNVLFPE
jgi:hypothetical protein